MEREYRPAEVERRWTGEWEQRQLFRARPEGGAEPFCMVIPPPNVTGDLHVGHVLVYTLHDIVARWRRMQGRDVLWLPGTDHAGIATQLVVERQLELEGLSREALGREAFEARVWQWKETYGGRITGALRRLGCSVDWSRERFTLDEGLSRAVRAVFVRLFREGLIYRDRAMVNWCPRCRTALSDLETIHEDVEGRLYTVRYPAAGGGGEGVRVATTRPETMFGDTAVAVHPADERFAGLVGRRVVVPLTTREVPIVADDFVDREFGTGAVKLTPAHDPNDFRASRRLGLPELVALDAAARMTEAAGAYAGLDRFVARERIVADLTAAGLLENVRPHPHAVGHCQRCSTMIEPLASTQWFVRIAPLAGPAIEAVERGRTRFIPPAWSKTYFEWMRNIHDWCISRQLWWGHRIPAWHCDRCASCDVAETAPAGCAACGGPLRQDDDVLDTWFSSALWPFSTLGWPAETADLRRYYPTSLLITGHDIIFFWVARMLMMGLRFRGDVPFHEVYIHGLVRDEHGQKMSKTKGNTVDPAELQQRYGTDAVRFTMAALAAPGNDIPLAPQRMEGYRAFANKLWNAARFVLLQVGDGAPGASRAPGPASRLPERWIRSRLQAAIDETARSLAEHRFDRAADTLYHFIWHEYCDWYIEMVKPRLREREGSSGAEARAVLLEVLERLLALLHPIMPFVTEEIWGKLPGARPALAVSAWPRSDPQRTDGEAERQVALIRELVVKVRSLRSECDLDPGRVVEVLVAGADAGQAALLAAERDWLEPLARATRVSAVAALREDLVAARGVLAGGLELAIPLAGLLDLELERARLEKELARVGGELDGRTRRLADAGFLTRAPADVVEKERRIERELRERKDRLEASLLRLRPGSAR